MKYLLIDFGASFIKTALYNKDLDAIEGSIDLVSPFKQSNYISKDNIYSILTDIINKYESIDGIVICSILGGYYKDDIYYSWKVDNFTKGSSCLISGLFETENTFHVHAHHKNTVNATNYESGLRILGFINGIPVYSSLSDTDCVTESIQLSDNDILINIGTGSQIITKNTRYSYIPAGRSFLVFEELFNSLGLSIFDLFQQINIDDVLYSTLEINLNNFNQAHKYINGGYIKLINEGSFNIKNVLGSILKEFVNQYSIYIPKNNFTNIILMGGIPNKLPILLDLFKVYYPDKNITIGSVVNGTHIGMINYIQKYL
jgi:hypothetical protein